MSVEFLADRLVDGVQIIIHIFCFRIILIFSFWFLDEICDEFKGNCVILEFWNLFKRIEQKIGVIGKTVEVGESLFCTAEGVWGCSNNVKILSLRTPTHGPWSIEPSGQDGFELQEPQNSSKKFVFVKY
jgi:hypothetical protein